eukprot:6104996-Amphidinium_carterae.2
MVSGVEIQPPQEAKTRGTKTEVAGLLHLAAVLDDATFPKLARENLVKSAIAQELDSARLCQREG